MNNEAIAIAIRREKIEVREKNGSVKIRKLGSDITGMLTETSMNLISTNRSTRSLRPVEICIIHAQLFRRRFSSPSHSSIPILSRLPHFARVTSFKKNRATEKSSLLLRRLEGIAKHKGFFRDSLFARKLTVYTFSALIGSVI